MGMLDAVVYSLVNQIKTLSTTINTKMDMLVGGWNNQLTDLRVGLTDTRIGFLDHLNSLENRLTTLWANQLTDLRSGLTNTRISFLDYLYSLENRLSDTWANQLTNLRATYTDTRAGYLDLINAMNTRLSSTWAAKLDSLRTAYTDARAGYLDLVNTLNNRLTDAWSAQLTSLRNDVTSTRLGYIDQIPSINSLALKSVKTWGGKLIITQGLSNISGWSMVQTNTSTYIPYLSLTGSGKLKFFCVGFSSSSSFYARIYVDGLLVMDAVISNNSGSSKLCCVVGSVASDGVQVNPIFDDLVFQTSLVVQLKATTSYSSNWNSYYELY